MFWAVNLSIVFPMSRIANHQKTNCRKRLVIERIQEYDALLWVRSQDPFQRSVPQFDFLNGIHGFSAMTSAATLQEPDVLEDQGFPPVRVRLNEPFETIVANNPELKVERTAEGETVFMSPTGGESGVQNAEITLQVGLWARTHGGIAFDSSTLFRLPNGALRSPDVSWIQTERWQSLTSKQRKTYPPITPDFVIELRSPSDRLSDVKEKMTEYAACGVRLGWLIDPLLKQVHIYKPDQTPVMMQDPKSVADETVLPGFVLDLSRIFV